MRSPFPRTQHSTSVGHRWPASTLLECQALHRFCHQSLGASMREASWAASDRPLSVGEPCSVVPILERHTYKMLSTSECAPIQDMEAGCLRVCYRIQGRGPRSRAISAHSGGLKTLRRGRRLTPNIIYLLILNGWAKRMPVREGKGRREHKPSAEAGSSLRTRKP